MASLTALIYQDHQVSDESYLTHLSPEASVARFQAREVFTFGTDESDHVRTECDTQLTVARHLPRFLSNKC